MCISSNLDIVCWMEGILQSLHVFFVHSPKKFMEFQNFANLLDTKSNKLLKNVKTHWISMLSPTKRVYAKFCPLIVKMHAESARNDQALKNLNTMCDVKLILGLPYILPLLECLHTHSWKLHKVEMCSCVILLKMWS
jgi:hypothetical protein